jgi:hypothetical protein
MRVSALLRLYPRSWRARYGEEMTALLDERPVRRRDRLDLARGALDAWLHPPIPSLVPIVAVLTGGGLWTIAAAAVSAQPVPPDWPGYLLEVVPAALAGTIFLCVAVMGCLLRATRLGGRTFGAVALLTGIGYVAWVGALAGTLGGAVDGPWLAAAQSLAMIATICVGLALVHDSHEPIGFLVLLTAVVMLIPWATTWLAFGPGWTALGIALFIDRSVRMRRGGIAGSASF